MPVKTIHKHVRKHKKKYTRFIIFFVIMVIYSTVEDIIAVSFIGIGLDFLFRAEHLIMIACLAMIFTAISEITEKIYEKNFKKK